MAPTIGYSNIRVNSIDSSTDKDEFGKWLHTPNFRTIKIATAQAVDGRIQQRPSFATLLKQADQDNVRTDKVELRPRANNIGNIDIIA